jgi:phosphatidylglycerol lysyltransferase
MASEFSDAASAIRQRPGLLARTFFFAIVCHTIDLVCLYAIFLAFDQPVGFGALVAGYSMAILFWIVSPTPQGVGVVEAVVAMVYTSLGVPGSKAVIISLAFRGLAFWIPLLVGVIVLRKVRSFKTEQRTRAKVFEVHVAAVAVALVGLVNIVSAVTPAVASRKALLDTILTAGTRHGAHLAAALAGFGLILLSRGLWRRKQTAWAIATALLVVSFISHLVKGLDYEEAVIVGALIVWLWSLRSHFHAMSDRPSVRQGVLVFAAAVVFTVFYGAVGFYLLDRHFAFHYNTAAAIDQTLIMFFEFYDPGLEPTTGFGHYFADSIYIVGIVTLGYSLLLMLRPVFLRQPATEEERARASKIVERHGRSSLAAVALLPDKSYFYSSGGSVISFVASSGIGLALGDPIGPNRDAASAVSEFKEYCAARDWRAAFYQTLPDYLSLYSAARLSALCVGCEATVGLAGFSLEGGENKPVRNSVTKLVKLGFTAGVHDPPLDDELVEELRMVSDEWLTTMHGSEKRFSLGWFDEDYIRSCPVMAVRAEDGTIAAFANIISEYQKNETSVDLMRRTADAPNGTMDFLFVSLFEWAKSQGFDTFNLGLSPLAGVGEESDDPMAEKALKFIYDHVNRFYGFKGLHKFKEKFGPEWSPRYLVYDGAAALLSTAYAIVSADSGGSLLWSYVRRRA